MAVGVAVQLRLRPEQFSKINDVRRARENPPTLQDMIRDLIARGLESECGNVATGLAGHESGHAE